MTELTKIKCAPCEGGIPALTQAEVEDHAKDTPEWKVSADHKKISREFTFGNFYETMAFVNAVAWIANQQDHHPDIEVSYSKAVVHYWTHAIDGLSVNDFICAARIDQIAE